MAMITSIKATSADVVNVLRWHVKKDRGNFMHRQKKGLPAGTIFDDGNVSDDELTKYDWEAAHRRSADGFARTSALIASNHGNPDDDSALPAVVSPVSPPVTTTGSCQTCKLTVYIGADAWSPDAFHPDRAWPQTNATGSWPPRVPYCGPCWADVETQLDGLAATNPRARGRKTTKPRTPRVYANGLFVCYPPAAHPLFTFAYVYSTGKLTARKSRSDQTATTAMPTAPVPPSTPHTAGRLKSRVCVGGAGGEGGGARSLRRCACPNPTFCGAPDTACGCEYAWVPQPQCGCPCLHSNVLGCPCSPAGKSSRRVPQPGVPASVRVPQPQCGCPGAPA
jgi:hypothetical protein